MLRDEALPNAVLRNEGNARGHGVSGRIYLDAVAVNPNFTRREGLPFQTAGARANATASQKARHTEHLSAMNSEVDVAWFGRSGNAAKFDQRFAHRLTAGFIVGEATSRAPDDIFDNLFQAKFAGAAR